MANSASLSTLPSASPRVRELALAVSASSIPPSSPRRAAAPASSSPVLARVRAFESAMRQSAGLKEKAAEEPTKVAKKKVDTAKAAAEEPARSTRTRQRKAEEAPMFPSPRSRRTAVEPTLLADRPHGRRRFFTKF